MRKLFALTIILLACFKGLSQITAPETFEIKTDTSYFQEIDPMHLLVLEDKNNSIQFKNALALYKAGKFHPGTEGADSNTHVHWFVYRLHNAMNRPARISLNSMSDYDNFYVLEDGAAPAEFISGTSADKTVKNGLKTINCIPLEMQSGKSYLVLQRVENYPKGLQKNFAIGITSTDAVIKEYYTDFTDNQENYFIGNNLLEAFIIGMVLIAIFMNLFFYNIVKEKLYLYFALFALFLGINRFYGISSYYFTFEYAWLKDYVDYLGYAWIFILFFLTRFFQSFLNSKNQLPKLNITANFFLFIYVAVYTLRLAARLFDITMPQWTRTIMTGSGFVVIPFLLIIFQTLAFKNSKANRYLFFGSFLYLLLLLTSQIATREGFNLFPGSVVSHLLYYNYRLLEAVFLALLIASLTWVLLMRFIELRKQNAQQALETERLAKEKEIEKNELIEKQKIQLEKDVAERTQELKLSLEELKATQSQLIQSEKMASLGELTAGIAHEIQNPLNFVNNFSEINAELAAELIEEVNKGNIKEIKLLAEDIKANAEKIHHHGKRADSIVKGMLQHSKNGSGQKEATDINKLITENLHIAYHGFRAKEKYFKAGIQTNLDAGINSINIVPQDIGRVLLNLFTNAFYAVNERRKKESEASQYIVSVNTKKLNNHIEIEIKDNGIGIPEKIVHKVFQPFFTTKPTGEGTGLGLSLAYDIIKAHNGEITVYSIQSQETVFIIKLPA